MRHHHIKAVSRTPAKAQDNLIIKLEGMTMWFELLANIPRTSLWKEFIFPDGTGGTGGTGGTTTP